MALFACPADPVETHRIQSGAIPECRLPHYGPDVTLWRPKDPKDPHVHMQMPLYGPIPHSPALAASSNI